MKHRLPLALLLLGLASPTAHAIDGTTEDTASDTAAIARPLPPIVAPSAERPTDETSLDAPPPPPPPIDLDYRAPATALPAP